MKTKLFIIIFTVCCASSFAQMKLANKFFKNYNYEKAIELYQDAYNDGDDSMEILTKLGDAYYNNSKTEESAKWYGLAIDKYESKISPDYIFKYIQSLVSIKNYTEAEKWAETLREIQKDNSDTKLYIDDNFDIYRISDNTEEDKRIVKLENVDFNTELSDFGAFIKDDVFYFASSRDKSTKTYDWNNQPFLDIYKIDINRSGKTLSFSNTGKLSSSRVNSPYHESSVAITNDGKTMYFTRDDLTKSGRLDYDNEGTTHLKLYKATWNSANNSWDDLELLPFNLEIYSSAHPALSTDNKKLYFASDRPGGYGASDLYVVDINDDGSFSEPKNLGDNINTPGRDTFPFIAKDNTLYYSSDGFVNFGLLDIFKSDYLKNPDAKSVNLGEPFNSSYDDFAYHFDSDTEEGYLSSNREGGKGSDDIYAFNTYFCEQSISGTITNQLTKEPISSADVKLVDDTGKILEVTETDVNGNYKFLNLLCEKVYTVVASKPDYKDEAQKTITTSDEKDKVNIVDLELMPLIQGNQIVINPIFFDFDKWNIRTDAQYELENIVNVLNEHPTMVIKIESHTDSRGSDRYNTKLSDRRAKSTRDYIISRGIEAFRIESAIGYGETQLLNKCSNGVKCTDEEHQLNRRSYFYIIKE